MIINIGICYYLHLMDGEIEAQRGYITCPGYTGELNRYTC